MKYEQVPAGQFIFKEGDLANDKLYIILSGKAHIIFENDRNVFFQENVNNEEKEEPKQEPKTEPKKSAWFLKKQRPTISEPVTAQATPNKRGSSIYKAGEPPLLGADHKKNDAFLTEFDAEKEQMLALPKLETSRSKKLAAVKPSNVLAFSHKELGEGEAFGEKALTSKDSKRSASIYASVDCQFMILMKEDYLSIVGKYHKENRFKLNFLQNNLPYVDRITSTLILEDFLYIFNTEFFKRGNTIIEEGTSGDRVYLLVHGECTIEKKILQEKSDTYKTVFIAKVSAPTMLGEEILYQKRSEREYKYTIKV
mgnify:CR=1 FL=1